MNIAQAFKLAYATIALNMGTLLWYLSRLADKKAPNSSWGRESYKLYTWVKGGMVDKPPFTIFTKGNIKLPFYSFSVLPIVTCSGAGACAKFCYSLKAWRYPSAFFRQLQNTLLVITQSRYLVDAWYNLKHGVDVRLYVDGDFDSVETVDFWFSLCNKRKDLKVYGYSKSWNELLAYKGTMPTNYKLNLSSGHNHNKRTENRVKKLSIVRGSFVAVPIDKAVVGQYKTKGYLESLKKSANEQGINKYFACTGKCDACTPKGHACGLDTFKDVPILIGIH
tara:strand:+ start:2247 stop:3083 length:837 start_codon:yes stop_codon:yes gene_type:complete